MEVLDIFNPQVSVVAKGLEGKVIMIYGNNNLGKTKVCSMMEKPLFLAFEMGLNAIAGAKYMNIQTWADFKLINKQLTSPKTVKQAKETYSTIILDEVYASSKFCQTYICNKYSSPTIREGNGGYGLWKEYEDEYWSEINTLVSAGYTIVFVAHEQELKDGSMYPKGDKRALGPIIDNCDIVAYLHGNGVDEDGHVIKSSAYFAEVPGQFFARSRFDYIDFKLPEFSAEGLESVIAEAIKRDEEANGYQAVSFEEQKASRAINKIPFKELKEKVLDAGNTVAAAGYITELQDIVKAGLGDGLKVVDATERHYDSLEVILSNLNTLIEDKGL